MVIVLAAEYDYVIFWFNHFDFGKGILQQNERHLVDWKLERLQENIVHTNQPGQIRELYIRDL